MSNLAESRLLRISSKDRADTSRSRYNIDFRTNDNELHQISRIVLKSIVVPNTQYNINIHTNTLYLPTSLSEVTHYTIKPGQYKTNDLITELKKVVNDTVGGGFNITQDPISFLLTLSVTTGTMVIYKDNNPMAFILGIETEHKATGLYECEKLPNLSGLNHIYISSQALSNHTQMVTSLQNKQNVFADVTVKVCFGQIQYTDEDTNSLDYVVFHGKKNISKIDIQLLDDWNNELDLNGRDWTLVFRIYK